MIHPTSECPELVIHWWQHHLPPGVAVAIVGCLGIVYALLRDKKASGIEKACWAAVLGLLTLLEIYSVRRDSIERSADHTRDMCVLASQAREALDEMTGRDSYLFVTPMFTLGQSTEEEHSRTASLVFRLEVMGRHPVWDARIIEIENGLLLEESYEKSNPEFNLSHPVTNSHLENIGDKFHCDFACTYAFDITTRGTSDMEQLTVSYDPHDRTWRYRYSLWSTGGHIAADSQLLKQTDLKDIPGPKYVSVEEH